MIKTTLKFLVLRYCMHSVLLHPLNSKILRPKLWQLIGCKVGKNVFIGYDVYIDIGNTNLITVEEGAYIANRSLILCHLRDLKNYRMYDQYGDLSYRKQEVIIKRGACIGMGSIILPGVTIGEGAIVGAGSIVSKNVAPWTIVGGAPAKFIKKIEEREHKN